MISSLLHILFPSRCFGCGKPSDPLCDRCLLLARKSLSVPHPYTTCVYDFKDPLVRRAIHAIKYYHRQDLILPLTSSLAEELRTLPDIGNYTLVPIPMSRLRQLLRGYNQAEKIATELSKMLSIPTRTDILARRKRTLRQVQAHTKAERLKNQTGSFIVTSEIAGDNFILIDDVTTTGATLQEARKVLLQKNARSVRAATLAH